MNNSPAQQYHDEPAIVDKQAADPNTAESKPSEKSTDQCLEEICLQGCIVVREVIEQLDQQQAVSSLSHLSSQSQQNVLNELKAVMSVYDQQ